MSWATAISSCPAVPFPLTGFLIGAGIGELRPPPRPPPACAPLQSLLLVLRLPCGSGLLQHEPCETVRAHALRKCGVIGATVGDILLRIEDEKPFLLQQRNQRRSNLQMQFLQRTNGIGTPSLPCTLSP